MRTSPLQQFPPRRRRKVRWLLGLLVAYAIVGFLILPPIVRRIAIQQLAKRLDRPVSIRSVRLNPFVLSATIRGLEIKDPDGQTFLAWDEFYANLQLTSFLSHPWAFKEIHLVHPFVRAQVNKDGSLNFSDLIAKFSAPAPHASPPARPVALRVGLLRIAGATALLNDLTPRTPFHRLAGPLDLTLQNFRTDPNSQDPYTLFGTTEAGEGLAWSGSLCFNPLRFQGNVSLTNLPLSKYQPLYQDLVRFDIRDGLLDVRAAYQFDLGTSNLVAMVTNASLSLRNFKLGAPGDPTNLVELSELSVRGASADFAAREAEIDSLHLDGPRVLLRRDASQGVNLANLARPAEDASAPGGVLLLLRSLTNAVDQLLRSTNTWSASLRQADLRNAALNFLDLAQSRPVRVDLDDIQVDAANLSNLPGSNWTSTVSIRWNTNGTLRAEAEASLVPPSAEVRLAVDRLDLSPVGPYLEPWLNVVFLSSELGLKGAVRLRTANAPLPVITFQGDVSLNKLSAIDGVLGEPLLDWSSLRISGLEGSVDPPKVRIRQISLNDATARVLIETNRTVNLVATLRPANPPAEPTETTPAPSSNAAPAGAQSAQAALAVAPRLSIGTVVLSNAAVRFTDRSVQPSVSTSLQPLNATISELSSESLGHAAINIEAGIDTVGRIRIQGTINPFSEQKSNDVSVTVQDVDLLPVSSYAGKYAGYRIARGKLGLDLAYHLRGRNLHSENRITLDHFTFGDRVQSPDATSLPVRLAVAILKDRNGQIQIDVPVDGSLDDPDFRVRKVILHTIVNLLTRAATSPFSLLGSLFGGRGEEVRYQIFAPGDTELPVSEKSKLDALAHALYERPGLQVEIQGSVDPVKDRDGLRSRHLEADLRTACWSSLGKSAREETSPDRIVLPPDERTRWIRKLYAKALEEGQIRSLPASASGAASQVTPPALYQTVKPVHDATRLMRSEAPPPAPAAPAGSITVAADPFEQALLNSITISEAEFETLASDRAKSVRDYLVQSGKVEPERVYLSETQPGGLNADGARTSVQFR